MRIGIIGAGRVGGTLGTRWARDGHHVIFGVRDPGDDKAATVARGAGPTAGVSSVAAAVSRSEIVVLAVPWPSVRDVVSAAGDLAGKVIVDATNPVELSAEGLANGLVLGHTTSGAEQIAALAPQAAIVKAFNTTGWQNMADPRYRDQPTTMFICGDDQRAKGIVAQLARELGFEDIDAGPLRVARLLEPVAMLWIHLAVVRGLGTDFALTLVRR